LPKIQTCVPAPRIRAEARADLRSIAEHSKRSFGPQIAHDYLAGLKHTIAMLARRPRIGSIEHGLGDDIRSFPHRSHRIYYREGDGQLTIIRILHQSQDAPAAFGGLQ
jgi:toxin ParE1/3/4